MPTMLDTLRKELADKLHLRTAAQADMDAIVQAVEAEARSDFNEAEAAKFGEARAKLDTLDGEITELRARVADLDALAERRKAADEIRSQLPEAPATETRVKVGKEEHTYRPDSEHQFFRDLVRANSPGGGIYRDEIDRLTRHRKETEVETRANMSRTDGQGGELVPPLWLMEQYVPLARAGRVTAELCRQMPLPPGTDSINLPKINTGATVAEQTEGSAASNTDMTTTSVSSAVTTFAGQQRFSMQLLDQSPLAVDEVVFADLLAAHAAVVDTYVINKASIGILNVTGVIAVTYTDASPTVPEIYPKIADAIQQIESNRYLPAQAIVMHPRRWAWFKAALDSNSRPLVVPNAQGPQNAFAGFGDVRAEGAVGELQGLPVYVDANVPTTLGGGTEDRIIIARFDDLYLYEGAMRTRTLFETDADTLQVRVQLWNYGGFLGSRYPKSIGVISGTGVAAPTF